MVHREDVLRDIRRANEKYDKLTITKFDNDPEFMSRGSVYKHFVSWGDAVYEAGSTPVRDEYSDKELLRQIEECYEEYGKVTRDILNGNERFAHAQTFANRFGTLTRAKRRVGVETQYSRLSEPRRQELDKLISSSDYHQSVLEGLVMGDASVAEGGNLHLEMKSRPFIEWVDEKFGDVSSSVSSTSDGMYQLILRNIESVKQYRGWYESGEKRFPESLELNPVNTKVWYCCDGGLNYSDNSASARFYTTNEDDRLDWICSLFRDAGFDAHKRKRDSRSCVYFYVDETKKVLEWMGKPLPGYEYKWVTQGKREYLKRKI